MILGVRFQPTAITRWAIMDLSGKTGDIATFFAGFWPDTNDREQPVHIPTWTCNPRHRREFDTHEEAAVEAALIVELGCRLGRVPEVVEVTLL